MSLGKYQVRDTQVEMGSMKNMAQVGEGKQCGSLGEGEGEKERIGMNDLVGGGFNDTNGLNGGKGKWCGKSQIVVGGGWKRLVWIPQVKVCIMMQITQARERKMVWQGKGKL